MPCIQSRDYPHKVLNEIASSTVITDRSQCCCAPDTPAEQFYSNIPPGILLSRCCDTLGGCSFLDTRTRCGFWPSFAHPRWLTCSELYSRHI